MQPQPSNLEAEGQLTVLQKLFGSSIPNNALLQVVWLAARLVVGGLMIHNGFNKLANVQGFADNVVSFIGLPFPTFFTYVAAYVEIVGSVLLAIATTAIP